MNRRPSTPDTLFAILVMVSMVVVFWVLFGHILWEARP